MKQWKKLAALLLALAMVCALAACGSKKPGAEDAKAYVKAVMDAMCTGEYDQNVKFADVGSMEELAELRETSVSEALEGMEETLTLSESNKEAFKTLILDAMGKAKYTVKDAVSDGEGGFNVTVTVEPLNLYAGMEDAINDAVSKLLEDPNVGNMSEEEIYDTVFEAVLSAMQASLDNPQYGEGSDIVVRYYEMEQGLYGIDGADGEKLGAALFAAE